MPPTREQFEHKYGDTILADSEDDEPGGPFRAGNKSSRKMNDENTPNATADVMMSRNLKGGAGKNFNFAFSSDGDESIDSPQKDLAEGSDGDDLKPVNHNQPSNFGGSGRPINLLSQLRQDQSSGFQLDSQKKTQNQPQKRQNLSA